MAGRLRTIESSARATIEDLTADGRGTVLLFLSVAWFVNFGIRMVYPVVVPTLQSVFGFGLTTTGVLLTTLWLMYAIGQLPGGILADRFGERIVLVGGLVLVAASLVIVSASIGLWMVFLGTLLTGLAVGLYSTTLFTVLANVFENRQGTAQGVTLAMGNAGSASLPVLAITIVGVLGWRAGFAYLLPLLAIATVGVWYALPGRLTEATPGDSVLDTDTLRRIADAIRTRSLANATVVMALVSLFFQAFTSFYPTYLLTVKGLSGGTVAALFSLFFVMAIVAQLSAGVVSDRIGQVRTLTIILGLATVGLLALPFANRIEWLILLTLLISFQSGTWPVINAYTIPRIPPAVQGGGFGMIRTSFTIVAAFGSTFVGIAADRTSLEFAFAWVGAAIVVTFLFVLVFLKE